MRWHARAVSLFLLVLSQTVFLGLAAYYTDTRVYYPDGDPNASPTMGYSWIWYHFENWIISLTLSLAAVAVFIFGIMKEKRPDWKDSRRGHGHRKVAYPREHIVSKLGACSLAHFSTRYFNCTGRFSKIYFYNKKRDSMIEFLLGSANYQQVDTEVGDCWSVWIYGQCQINLDNCVGVDGLVVVVPAKG